MPTFARKSTPCMPGKIMIMGTASTRPSQKKEWQWPGLDLGDKLARFKSLTKSGVQEVKDESIRDTLIDLANYAIMTVLEMDDLKMEGTPNDR